MQGVFKVFFEFSFVDLFFFQSVILINDLPT